MDNEIIRRKLILWVIYFILFLGAGVLLFKNYLLFSEDLIDNPSLDSELMVGYSCNDDYFSAEQDAAIIVANRVYWANEVEIKFEEGLKEDTTFVLYCKSVDSEEQKIGSKTIRKGFKSVNFYFETAEVECFKVVAKDNENNRYVDIPFGTLYVFNRKFNFMQKNTKYLISIIILLGCSILLSGLVVLGKERNIKNQKSETRNSNIELLRVICMLLLVAHHFSGHSGLLELPLSLPKYIGLAFLPVGKICFIAFLAISMFYLADGEAKSKRFIKCWLEVLFYSVSLTVISWMMGAPIHFKDLISSFMVMLGNSHGFAAAYLLFLMIYPFVVNGTKNCTKVQARYLLLFTFGIQVVSPIIYVWTGYSQPVYSELTLFILCYFISLNLKRYPIAILDNKLFAFSLLLLSYFVVFVAYFAFYSGKTNSILMFMLWIMQDESSIVFIIGGYSLFYLFKNINITLNRFINSIAAGTFGVLLIHDHNFFRLLFWNDVIRAQTFFGSKYFSIEFVFTVFAIFYVCIIIDFIRRELLERKIINSQICANLSEKIDKKINFFDK